MTEDLVADDFNTEVGRRIALTITLPREVLRMTELMMAKGRFSGVDHFFEHMLRNAAQERLGGDLGGGTKEIAVASAATAGLSQEPKLGEAGNSVTADNEVVEELNVEELKRQFHFLR